MTQSFSKRRRAEHARRRREEAERVREAGGDPSELAREIREARGSSQLSELPGETWEDIFSVSPTERVDLVLHTELSDRTTEEQERFVRAIVRKFQAHEVSADSGIEEFAESATADDSEKCALCRRDSTRRVLGKDGRKWCSGSDGDACVRIAQGRLGGASAPGRSSLSGKLRPDGDCRRCGNPVKWVKTQRGKKMPVDVAPAPSGVAAFELVGQVNTLAFYVSEKKRATYSGDLYESHFQTCEAT